MTVTTRLLCMLGGFAQFSGFVLTHVREHLQQIQHFLFPYRNWRVVSLGDLVLRVPPGWSEVEPDPAGGFVIHNRPERFRIEGDAVWYGSAIELRIRQSEASALGTLAPMSGITRKIETHSGPVMLTLAVANGVGPRSRRTAFRVLRSARVVAKMRQSLLEQG
jgi:hypothetical protein